MKERDLIKIITEMMIHQANREPYPKELLLRIQNSLDKNTEEKLTSDNSQYAKFPSFEDVYTHTGEVFEDDCRHVYDIIKELGNFA